MSESYTSEQLQSWLRRAAERLGAQPNRIVVAFSGGRDSSVLLHALSLCKLECALHALHVNHELQAPSGEWAEHCVHQARQYGVSCDVLPVKVKAGPGASLEEAARDARYQALRSQLRSGDWLLLAQHADDQAETFLLQLMRGAASRGLSAMPEWRELNGVYELRPLLKTPREALEAYLQAHQLAVVDDPHNLDLKFDRVFVREQLLPLLQERWPQVNARLGASSEQLASDADLVAILARGDLAACRDSQGRLSVECIGRLSLDRRCALLREWLLECGELMPSRKRLMSFLEALRSSRSDHQAELKLGKVVVRHFQNRLYRVSAQTQTEEPGELAHLQLAESKDLGQGLGQVSLLSADTGATLFVPPEGLQMRRRSGGERIQLVAGNGRRAVKDLLREAGVVPWMRNLIPLFYAGETLVAVGDLWVASHAKAVPNARLRWDDRPALF